MHLFIERHISEHRVDIHGYLGDFVECWLLLEKLRKRSCSSKVVSWGWSAASPPPQPVEGSATGTGRRPLAAAVVAATQRHSAGVCPPVRVKVLSASESRGFGTCCSPTPLRHKPASVAMRRKQKRLLQFVGLVIVALLFLPNVGLWSLYRDRVFDNSPDTVDGPGGLPLLQVRIRLGRAGSSFLCCGDGIYTECELGTPPPPPQQKSPKNAAGLSALTFPRMGSA